MHKIQYCLQNVVEKVKSDKRFEIWNVKTVMKSHEQAPEYSRLFIMLGSEHGG